MRRFIKRPSTRFFVSLGTGVARVQRAAAGDLSGARPRSHQRHSRGTRRAGRVHRRQYLYVRQPGRYRPHAGHAELSRRAQPGPALGRGQKGRRNSGSRRRASTRTTGKTFPGLSRSIRRCRCRFWQGSKTGGDSNCASSRWLPPGWRGYVQDPRIELVAFMCCAASLRFTSIWAGCCASSTRRRQCPARVRDGARYLGRRPAGHRPQGLHHARQSGVRRSGRQDGGEA